MKYICIILWLIPIFSFSQIEDPVSWSFNVEKLGKDKYNLKVVAQIEDGWHIYSQYKDPDSFIRETSFYFELIDDVKFIDTKIQKIDDLSVKILTYLDPSLTSMPALNSSALASAVVCSHPLAAMDLSFHLK